MGPSTGSGITERITELLHNSVIVGLDPTIYKKDSRVEHGNDKVD